MNNLLMLKKQELTRLDAEQKCKKIEEQRILADYKA